MTDDPQAHLDHATPAGPSLRIVRAVMVVGLTLGLGIFGFAAINDLAAGFGHAPTSLPDTLAFPTTGEPPQDRNPLRARTAGAALSGQFTPIDHDPADLPPYPEAQRGLCHVLPAAGGITQEQAHYRVVGHSVAQVLGHYRRVADGAGFQHVNERPHQHAPGGITVNYQRGEQGLSLSVSPSASGAGPDPNPPARGSAVSIVTQFRYPTTAQP